MLFILFPSNYDWQLTFSAVIRTIIFIKVAPVYTVVALYSNFEEIANCFPVGKISL